MIRLIKLGLLVGIAYGGAKVYETIKRGPYPVGNTEMPKGDN